MVVMGVGNPYRRDDGVGPALAAAIGALKLPDVTVLTSDGEPGRLLDAWSGAELAVVVDAMCRDGGKPGQIHRVGVTDGGPASDLACSGSASTHGLGIGEAIALARALDRLPVRLVVYAVEADDVGHGEQLSPSVTASLPRLTELVLAELRSA